MADKQISDLTSASALTDGSLFVLEQAGAAKKANWGMMKNYISPGVAPQYSSSATYNVGDYVIYNGQLYRCTTAITTQESWTVAHWTAAVLGDDVGELKSALKDVISHNSADLIPLFATYNNRTVFDITFTFSADKKSCIADGTATGPARTYLFNDLHAVPDEIKPGETYHVKVTSTSQYLYLYFIFYDANETIILTQSIGRDKDLTIPEETIGIAISVAVSNGRTVNNAQITFEILNAKSNKTLETDIDAIAENVRTGALTVAQGDIISGTYNSTGGVVANSARIRTNDFIKTYEGEELIFNPGTKAREMLIGYFDTEKRFIKDGTWVSSADPITMTNGYILLAYRTSSGNEAIAPSDYDADTYIIADWRADIDVLMNGTVENIPLYYFDNDYLPGKANEVNQIGLGLSRKSGRWVFITDYHSAANAGHSPSLIHYLLRKCGIKNTVFNGDAITRYDSKIMAYNELCNFVDSFNRVSEISSMYYVTGNHEYNNSDLQHSEYELSKSALFMLCNDPLKDAVCLANTHSFYVDDNNAKIRYYFIDCERGALIAVATIRSVLKSLENTPNDYGVVIFSHTGLTIDNSAIIERFEYILAGFKAWNDGVNYMYEGVTYNYEGTATEREFVGAITGHTHLEGYIIYDGRFPVIAVPCDCYKAPQQVSHPERVAGTIFEQAFEVLQIDIDAKRIYLTRIGWGNNRTFSFGSGAGLIT